MARNKLAFGKVLILAPSDSGYRIVLDLIRQSCVELLITDGDGNAALASGALQTLSAKDAAYRPPGQEQH
jgi:hypothetical protein